MLEYLTAETIAIAASALAIVTVNITIFGWLRSDMKSFESDIRKDMSRFQRELRADIRRFERVMQREARDFHGRLCAIEERNKK